MVSAFSNPGLPPLMAPEAQSPGLFGLGKSNFTQAMADPAKNKIANAMLGQQLSKIGQGFFAPALMQGSQRKFDSYGNPLGG
jgi:hypothetical protein